MANLNVRTNAADSQLSYAAYRHLRDSAGNTVPYGMIDCATDLPVGLLANYLADQFPDRAKIGNGKKLADKCKHFIRENGLLAIAKLPAAPDDIVTIARAKRPTILAKSGLLPLIGCLVSFDDICAVVAYANANGAELPANYAQLSDTLHAHLNTLGRAGIVATLPNVTVAIRACVATLCPAIAPIVDVPAVETETVADAPETPTETVAPKRTRRNRRK